MSLHSPATDEAEQLKATMSTPSSPRKWFHTASIYQCYPSSFRDTTATGLGDLAGIMSKVDYIASLGVDAVWLSPCYKSPNVDMGYDISDYRAIDPRYGTIEDIEKLVQELRKRGVRLLLDLVVNHTSDQHPWFQESRSNKHHPKRSWYIWRPGRTEVVDGKEVKLPPNNWASLFTGSAWTYDEHTDEWFLHIFCSEQPDLNWQNADLRRAVYGDMRFWLDKGIAGFRMDVINMISKPTDSEGKLTDAPVTDPEAKWQQAANLYCNDSRVHEYLREMRDEVLDRYPDIIAVGEAPFTYDPAVVRAYVEPERRELSALLQYDILDVDVGPGGKFTPGNWTIKKLKSMVVKWQQALSFPSGAWQTVFLESHDSARSISRFGDRTVSNRGKVAKMLAMLETTLAGTLCIYQGQELGLTNLRNEVPIEDYPDVETQNMWRTIKEARQLLVAESGEEVDMSDVAEQVRLKARDHSRQPIPWDASKPHAGFSECEGKTWSPMNTDAALCNVVSQEQDPSSVLNFWRQMLKLRRNEAETLCFGDFEVIGEVDEEPVFAYWRRPMPGKDARTLLVVLNMTAQDEVRFKLPACGTLELRASTRLSEHAIVGIVKEEDRGQDVLLKAYEGMVMAVAV